MLFTVVLVYPEIVLGNSYTVHVHVFYCRADATRGTTVSVQHGRADFHQATIDRCSS